MKISNLYIFLTFLSINIFTNIIQSQEIKLDYTTPKIYKDDATGNNLLKIEYGNPRKTLIDKIPVNVDCFGYDVRVKISDADLIATYNDEPNSKSCYVFKKNK